jgi:hypothetical protein
MGRGKVERLFRFIDTSFKPEAYQQIESGKISTLEELNRALAAWLDGYYHVRVHGGTGETPKARLEKSKREPRRIPVIELVDIFLWEEERRVDKTGCVKVAGNLYEVDLALVGKKVTLRFNPFDLSLIQVWHNNSRCDNALPLELNRPRHRRVKPNKTEKKAPVTGGISFFEAAEKKRRQELEKEPLSFATKGGTSRDGAL